MLVVSSVHQWFIACRQQCLPKLYCLSSTVSADSVLHVVRGVHQCCTASCHNNSRPLLPPLPSPSPPPPPPALTSEPLLSLTFCRFPVNFHTTCPCRISSKSVLSFTLSGNPAVFHTLRNPCCLRYSSEHSLSFTLSGTPAVFHILRNPCYLSLFHTLRNPC